MEYRSVILAHRFAAPLVTIELSREPLDLTYAAFVLSEIQSGAYEDCFAALIQIMDSFGM